MLLELIQFRFEFIQVQGGAQYSGNGIAFGKAGNIFSGKVGLGNLYCRQSLQETSPAPLLLDQWLSSKAALTYLLETSK